MDFGGKLISSIAVLVGLIGLAMLLRRLGLLRDEHGGTFAKLVTHVTLPALIFASLARHRLQWHYAELALVMLLGEIVCLGLAWLVGRGMRLERPQMGALMLASGFGSSAFLGYALITEVFPNNVQAMSEAVLVSELGVAPALFTVGVALANYYGSEQADWKGRISTAASFFWSPIFVALVAGMICSAIDLPRDSAVAQTLFAGLDVMANANTLLVALTVGILLHFEGFGERVGMVTAACAIKLLVQPFIVWLPTLVIGLSAMGEQVLILQAAMPTATLSVVFCSRYGCDARAASVTLFVATLLSSVTVLAAFYLLG